MAATTPGSKAAAPACTLLVFIDDATGRLMQLHFTPTESAFAYFEATRSYLERHGKPVAFYSDKASIFRATRQSTDFGRNATQFGRALFELNVDILCANSSQAKGRVERANLTLQDRLVKELRLRKICTRGLPTSSPRTSSPTSTPASPSRVSATMTRTGHYVATRIWT